MNINAVWKFYKSSKDYDVALQRFKECDAESLAKYYNPEYAVYMKTGLINDIADTFYYYGLSDLPIPCSTDEAEQCFAGLGSYGIMEEGELIIAPQDYELLMAAIVPLSYAASAFSPEFFYPYLFLRSFAKLGEILNEIGVTLPPTPKKSALAERYMYYWSICQIFRDISIKYDLTPNEVCVFIYDFLPSIISKATNTLPKPTQCWFIGGIINKFTGSENESWQVNRDTQSGDILVHYETTPKSAVTTIWRAESNGYVDPFFHWHSCAQIGQRISIPHITLAELKQDEYFSTFPLTRKNFQGVNGFPMPAEAYNRLLEIIATKGGDVSSLPKLYAPIFKSDASINNEKDVEERLIIPLLESLGLQAGRDYKQQMGIHVGTGHRVIPDFVIHYKEVDGEEEARILIEAKYEMSNRKNIDSAFKQARSYALNLKADCLITCDKSKLLIYTKTQGDFHKDKYTCLPWADIENPDIFNNLRKIFL
ncbi:MAG: DNA recombination protein RmuC [Bacteroides sp.]|nr:DNA recombination protein RmuC [Bacteroides sp.]